MGDAFNSLVEMFKDRAKSRFWLTFVFVFIVHNWKFFYILLAIPYDNSLYFNSLRMAESHHSDLINFYLYPIAITFFLIAAIPYIDAILGHIQIRAIVWNKTAHHEAETRVAEKKADLLSREQNALLKSERIQNIIQYLRDDFEPLTKEDNAKFASIKKQYEPYREVLDSIYKEIPNNKISKSDFDVLKNISTFDSDYLVRPLLIQKHRTFINSIKFFISQTENTDNTLSDDGFVKFPEYYRLTSSASPFELLLGIISNYESFMKHIASLEQNPDSITPRKIS